MSAPCDFDAVIVGSGFGGAVSAFRLAAANWRVCVLERGKAYPPGAFARTPDAMRRNLWDPSEGLHGLFDLWSFRGLEALVSSGLGGGSLIYANVLLRMPAEWFERRDAENGHAPWPLRRADLEPHYDRVEHALGAQRYPLHEPGYDRSHKTHALLAAAAALPERPLAQLPPLAVTFANPGQPPRCGEPLAAPFPNLHNAPRRTCTLCGECDLGCNQGSKNTLDHTYLSAAAHAGADIRVRCEVRDFRPLPGGGGFEVRFVRHHETAEGQSTYTAGLPLERITTRRLLLAAGSLGTTFLLLRNRRAFPGIDATQLGTRFCGNGDWLAFARERESPDGSGPLGATFGPVITAALLGERDGQRYCLEDGGIPEGMNWILQVAALPSRWRRLVRLACRFLAGQVGFDTDSNLSAELSSLFGPSALPLLGMGREMPNGRLYLRRGQLQSTWRYRPTRRFYRAIDAVMADATARMRADYERNPLGRLRRIITVHPLGGCPMGRSRAEGVVDQFGAVFGVPGLHVVDGAAMRGPVGVNPSLTIAAFADRCADELIRVGPEAPPRP